MKTRYVDTKGEVKNPYSSDFNDDELMNIAAGGGGERMGTRMLAAELLAVRDKLALLDLVVRKDDPVSLIDVQALIELALNEPMLGVEFGPRHEAGE